ncbi:YcjX family protein [Cohaesibacter celericrescens]|uniref:Amino acid regulated cytosolic protein n=1 Tax=Cohaesibacter celericrescens TaxID=2067669 RepID=A0A2N5XLT6_9HYPH|nr:YcjX family protein [Cohaesibacter celericrescens]PLW75453.1 amino acid regulated cytosolic protein [Cohaesibacter celericrescens]PLW78860.1 amino acid regulated cytosolic protein [Cohaesibacter celericrescens]
MKLFDEVRIATSNLTDFASDLAEPTLRLGVTGLARAGKTIFISSSLHNIIHGGRLPRFEAHATGRIGTAEISPHPDTLIPRFRYEDHIADLTDTRVWPSSTSRTSQVRLSLRYQSKGSFKRTFQSDRLALDIVDYPGEWLLDLTLMDQDYRTWSARSFKQANKPLYKTHSHLWRAFAEGIHGKLDTQLQGDEPVLETIARETTNNFTAYLLEAKKARGAYALLTPGRFLMPGDLQDSPALTFAPLPDDLFSKDRKSLWAMMERRFEAYKNSIIVPFYRDHFARLDRQIVLIDLLAALNEGPETLAELEETITEILRAFRPGSRFWLRNLVSRRIDKILFAATKADHLHHTSHDRLERILNRLVERAAQRLESAGADYETMAIAAVRATREATLNVDGEDLPSLVGIPMAGESLGEDEFDGISEFALFPGDLPTNFESLFEPIDSISQKKSNTRDEETSSKAISVSAPPLHFKDPLRFVRFRPPELDKSSSGTALSLPHIRLDRALEFLLGDILK